MFFFSFFQASSPSSRRCSGGTSAPPSASSAPNSTTPRGLLQLFLAAAAALAAANVPLLASAELPSLGDALRAGPLAALAGGGGGSSSSPSPSSASKLYNVQPGGTCGLPGQFLSITVTGTSGSLSNTACSLETQGFPDPQPEEDCDGLLFGKECSVLDAGLVVTVGGFGKGTDGPDVGALLKLLGLSKLERVGGLFFDVGDGAKVKHVDALPRLETVGPGGLQLLGSKQIQAAPGMRNVKAVEGPTYLVATALPDMGSLLPSATELAGGVVVVNNPSLASFSGISPNLTSIGGSLVVAANHRLRSFEGMQGLSSVGIGGGSRASPSAAAAVSAAAPVSGAASATAGVSITNNTRLTSLKGLSGLTTVGGGLQVSNNPTLVSLAGLEAVASVGGGAKGVAGGVAASAVAGTPANAGVLVTGNRVLSDVSALATVGRCSARKEAAAKAKAAAGNKAATEVDGTPPVQVEVYVVSGFSSPSSAAAPSPSAAAKPSPESSNAADLPPQINDAASPRQAELAAAAARAVRAASVGKAAPAPSSSAAAFSEKPLRVQAVESEEEVAIREAVAEEEGEEERSTASEASSDKESSSDGSNNNNNNKSVVSKKSSPQDKEAAALAAALQAAGYNGVDEAAVAAALEAGATEEELVAAVAGAVAQRAKEGKSASSPSPSSTAAKQKSRRSLAQFGGNPLEQLLGASPLGPLLPQPEADGNARLASEGDRRGGGGLLPLPPLPWNSNNNDKRAPSSSTTVADAQLAAAVAIRPDTKCMLTSWDDVCAFIENGSNVPADSPWRASGVCVPYSQPAPPTPASSTGNAGGLRISGK